MQHPKIDHPSLGSHGSQLLEARAQRQLVAAAEAIQEALAGRISVRSGTVRALNALLEGHRALRRQDRRAAA